MHYLTCLHPKTIFNKYLNEKVVVPCRTCPACLNMHALLMQTRLECESSAWTYSYFFTLTYDNEHLPLLQLNDHMLLDNSVNRIHPILGNKVVNVTEQFNKLGATKEQRRDSYQYIKDVTRRLGGLPYVSSVDCQRFMKRLRKRISVEFPKRTFYKHENITPQVRYFICSEYGPNTFRPHYHGILFFNSQWLASYIPKYLREAWKYGFTNSSFVSHSASAYVSSYLSSYADMPTIYKTPALRPFALFSKHPAIGTIVYSSELLRQMFLSNSVTQVTFKKGFFDNVPLWQTLQARLYPRLSFFDKVPATSRVRLYALYDRFFQKGVYDNVINFKLFLQEERKSVFYLDDYLNLLEKYDGSFLSKIERLYLLCKRVSTQSRSWNISVTDYAKHINNFYQNKDSERLRSWYQYLEQHCKDYPSDTSKLLGIDSLFFEEYSQMDLGDLTYDEILYFKNYNLDLEKFFSKDLSVRFEYQKQFLPESSIDYQSYKLDSEKLALSKTKTKKKNDYENSYSDTYAQLLTGALKDSKVMDLPFQKSDFISSKF